MNTHVSAAAKMAWGLGHIASRFGSKARTILHRPASDRARPAQVRLLRRFRAVLRRRGREGTEVLRYADLALDLTTHEVVRNGRRIDLTRTEFMLLELFLRHPREVLTRGLISRAVWGFDFGSTSNSLNVRIGQLRRKLEDGGRPRLIHTVRGVGYVLRNAQDRPRAI